MWTTFLRRHVRLQQRRLELLSAACVLWTMAGCGGAATSTTASTSSGTTATSSPPTTTAPVSTPPAGTAPTTKPKFAYVGNQGASLSGYSVDPATGALTPLSGFPLPVGGSPTSLAHDPQNRFLFVSDIADNMLHVYAINPATGALTEIAPSPYNTMIESETVIVDPAGTHVYLYRTGGSAAYPGVSGNQIAAFNLSAAGVLTPVKGSPFAIATSGDSAFGMVIDPAGKFLYLTDSTHLYSFSIDANTGGLTLIQTQPAQQFSNIAMDPHGSYLYAVGGTSLQTYSIDPTTGLPSVVQTTTGRQTGAFDIAVSPDGSHAFTAGGPVLLSYTLSNGIPTLVGTITSAALWGQKLTVDPSGSFVYIPQSCSYCPGAVYNIVNEFGISKTGALVPLSTPTVASGVTPFDITVTSQ